MSEDDNNEPRVAMFLLPLISAGVYSGDAWFLYITHSYYSGFLSTVSIIFFYLQFSTIIESNLYLLIYHTLICLLMLSGDIAYILYYIATKNLMQWILFIGYLILHSLFTALMYYKKRNNRRPRVLVEQSTLFHYISRLEIVFALFIPIFSNEKLHSRTTNNIAFFILFDFFFENYKVFRCRSKITKFLLYVFVIVVTVSAFFEWLFYARERHLYENLSAIPEIFATALCCYLIFKLFE
ncbi:unnamed protein product [Didymodactylos carnosus]|uniref:Uncharacterized protein n=1 Tax=Didymodactylos carnosus TaxID=1234261 RepID=A0A815VS96_9BILA|nr:unnamed protein product [Didymodactylos carnosus]CAF4393779.1 unnamed protein product [Didymodactylos carnosus]